jgi:ribosomal protein S6
VFIADPRLSDEETVALADEYRAMITADGSASVTKEESWGKRKLA